MSEGNSKGELAYLRETAALGCLLNAVAHDLNNQLTNLMLRADQAQYTGSKDAIDLMVKQAQRITEITRAVQALGQRNMAEGSGRVPLADVVAGLSSWEKGVTVGDLAEGAAVMGKLDNLVLALSLLAQVGREHGSMDVSIGIDEVPRSSWSGNSETVPMAVVRMVRGTPPDEPNPKVAAMIDDFFGSARDADEVGVMAAWEILRKLRGRPSARLVIHGPSGGGSAVILTLPLAD
ncbi:MAG: hypothetical protein GY898_06880 [Proteobacteria bacterium]|nr:hypothetical protein [Pseudomonadota bacterium]